MSQDVEHVAGQAPATLPRKGPVFDRFRIPHVGSSEPFRAMVVHTGEKREVKGKKGTFRPAPLEGFVVHETPSTPRDMVDLWEKHFGADPVPRLEIILYGDTPEDVWVTSARLFGRSGLHRICNLTTCQIRSATGWDERPCVCRAENIPEDDDQHCAVTHTLRFLIVGFPVLAGSEWSTKSEHAYTAWVRFLHHYYRVRGSLRGLRVTMVMTQVTSNPVVVDRQTGEATRTTSKNWVPLPVAIEENIMPEDAIAITGADVRTAIGPGPTPPPLAADVDVEATALVATNDPPEPPAVVEPAPRDNGEHTPGDGAGDAAPANDAEPTPAAAASTAPAARKGGGAPDPESVLEAARTNYANLDNDGRRRLGAAVRALGMPMHFPALIEKYGEWDMTKLIRRLEDDAAAAAQTDLLGGTEPTPGDAS